MLYTGEGEDDANDAGMQTIAQMLQQGSSQTGSHYRLEKSTPGAAIFTGKQGTDRNVSSSGAQSTSAEPASGSRRASNTEDRRDRKTPAPPHGYFSAPIGENEPTGDTLFGMRRNSVSGSVSFPKHADRPPLKHEGSGETERGLPSGPVNDSAQASGSGLPQKGRAPVGQPQGQVNQVNFRDRSGPSASGEKSFATARNPPRRSNIHGQYSSTHESSTVANESANHNKPADGQFDIKEPKPRSVGAGGLEGLATSAGGSSSSTRPRSSVAALETDEDGEKSLIHDFSGIVRLDSLHENDVTSGHGTGTKSSTRDRTSGNGGTGSGKASGPTGARLAQQQRQAKLSNTNDTVRNFINDQAKTVNLPDPNAPTPAPTPHESGGDTNLEGLGKLGRGEGLGIRGNDTEGNYGESSDDSSMSVRDSSEMATASGDEERATGDEGACEPEEEELPITTLRFEHVATEDGHHVVVGREGLLQRCEDEPITTPGAVQGFGVLLVLEEDYDTGRLTVRQASEVSSV